MTDDRTADSSRVDAAASPRSNAETAGSPGIERALGRLVPPGASASVLAVRADDGAVVAALDPDRAVTPASNTKLITAALALEHLGPDRRLETAFAARGRIEDGVLDGDLVVRGTGAPGVDRADIRTLADAAAARIDRLEGDLLLDTSRFEGPRFGPGRVWTDARHAYGAPSSALALEGNVVSVTVRASEEVVAAVDPGMDAVAVDVAARVDPAAAEPDGDDRDLDVYTDPCSGPPDAEATVEVPVADPIRHFGAAAGEALSAAGVDVAGSVRIADGPVGTDQQLAAVESASVAGLVRSMNVDSDNVVADSLARSVATTVTGEGSWAAWVVDDRLSSLGVWTASTRDASGSPGTAWCRPVASSRCSSGSPTVPGRTSSTVRCPGPARGRSRTGSTASRWPRRRGRSPVSGRSPDGSGTVARPSASPPSSVDWPSTRSRCATGRTTSSGNWRPRAHRWSDPSVSRSGDACGWSAGSTVAGPPPSRGERPPRGRPSAAKVPGGPPPGPAGAVAVRGEPGGGRKRVVPAGSSWPRPSRRRAGAGPPAGVETYTCPAGVFETPHRVGLAVFS
jgi:D-alanyl-D-alanine carboxypeptidase/D-alanyl-D-alanine-endopeptidase (penicillin-binding protein 4)